MTMEIYIAKSAGFCFGVKRAINIAVASADSNKGGDIHTLGPIIHNPQVVETLEKTANITAKDSLDDIKGGTVIIRSHGVKYEEINEAKRKGLNIVDATCPFVKKTHELVSELTADGYFVVVVGEKEHPEVQGMVSYGASADIVVVAGVEGLKAIGRKKKIGIVAQTTQSESRFREIAEFCRTIADEVKVCNTICSATSVRQEDSVEISRLVDCVIVVGGKTSQIQGVWPRFAGVYSPIRTISRSLPRYQLTGSRVSISLAYRQGRLHRTG